MAIRDLLFKSKMDNTGLKKGAGEVRKSLGQIESAGARMSKSMKNMIGGIGFGALAAGINKAMKAQSEQIDSINKLNQALANQGNFSETASKSLQAYASAMQEVTTFGDEQILQTQALLASYGGTEEQIKRTTGAVLDMAAATGTDLKAAGDLMGKAMVGYTGTLSRYGIIIDQNLPKSEKFEEALRQVEQRFSGQAQLAAQTYSGAMKQLGNAVGDVWEAFGKLFGYMAGQGDKPFAGLIKAVQWLVKFIGTDVVLTIGEFRAKFSEAMATLFEIGAKAFDVLAKLPGEMGKQFQGYADTLKLAAADSRLFADEQRIAAVNMAYSAGKTADVTNATQGLSSATKEVTEAEKKRLEELKKLNDSIPQLEVKTRELTATLVESARESGEAFDFFAAEGERLQGTLNILGPSVRQVYLEFNTFASQIEELGGVMGLTDTQLLNAISHMEGLADAGKLTADQYNKLGDAYTEALSRGILPDTETATKRTIDWSQALQDVSNQFQGMPGIVGEVASLIGNIAQQVAGMGASLKSLQSGFASFQSGGGFLDKLGGIAGMIPGVGGLIGGAMSIFGGIKSLFGGKSKEEKAAEEARKKAWQDLSATLEEQYGSLGQLQEQAAKYGVDLSKAMDTKDAEAMNKQLKELEKRQKGLRDAATGISKVIENIKPTTEAGAMAQAGLFSTVFWATVQREGLMAASESLRGAFDTLMEGASEAMQEFLAPIATQMNLAANEAFAGAAEGAAGLAEAIKGMSDAGIISIQDLTNAGTVAMDAYNQALGAAHQEGLEGAAAQEAAIRAVGPAIAQIKSAYEAAGIPIDANTQALIDQAQASGMAFATSPMERAAHAMEQVAFALGKAFGFAVDLGDAFGGVAGQANRAAQAANRIPANVPGAHIPGGGIPEGVTAQGGYGPAKLGRDTLIQAHRGEGALIVKKSDMQRGAFVSAQGGLGTPGPSTGSHIGLRGSGFSSSRRSIQYSPQVVVQDASVVKTPEGQRAFQKETVKNIYQALDQNAEGLARRIEYQQRTRCRSRI
jgi:hypothetical protein